MVARREDWALRLAAYVESRESIPFNWGHQDCCTFAAGAVREMTGADPMESLRGYRTAEQAGRILSRPLESFVDELFSRVEIGEAQRGDLALVATGKRRALMIFEALELVGAGESGLVRVPRSSAIVAWRV